MKKEITTTELFEAMGAFSEEMMRQFEKCATKEDLKGFATKEDLKTIRAEMATKEDLKLFATKEDLKTIRAEMVTKSDLTSFKDGIRQGIRQEIGRVISFFSPMAYKADHKVNALMERLVSKRVLARSDVKDLLEIHPLVS
jgi:hypothetical protein